ARNARVLLAADGGGRGRRARPLRRRADAHRVAAAARMDEPTLVDPHAPDVGAGVDTSLGREGDAERFASEPTDRASRAVVERQGAAAARPGQRSALALRA